MMDTYCSKCGISQSYYSRKKYDNLNCRYHSNNVGNFCSRCSANPRYTTNCYHDWEGPFDRLFNNIQRCILRLSNYQIPRTDCFSCFNCFNV